MRTRSIIASGWVPAALLAIATLAVLAAYETPIDQVATFAAYVVLGLAVPGMLWVRWLRGRPGHIAEDLALGTAAGYCLELGSYVVTRAAGLPQLFLIWPVATLVLFASAPSLRRYWRADPLRAPTWWGWALATILAIVLGYTALTFYAQHSLVGTYVPYVDMPFHLALIGELKNHVPPQVPWVAGIPLAYHWFFYAEAAATSWATGIEPATLLFRLSGLPMFVVFVVLTAAAARRLTGTWWSGPAAAAIALFGSVATPYAAVPGSVSDAQALSSAWISPTNLFGLAMIAAVVIVLFDVVGRDGKVPARTWILLGLLVLGGSGAKSTLLPLLLAGLATAAIGGAIVRRRLDRAVAVAFGLVAAALVLAFTLVYRGVSGGLTAGLESLRLMPIAGAVAAPQAQGIATWLLPTVTLAIALVLWAFLWAGAAAWLTRPRRLLADPRLLLLLGVCGGALAAATLFNYPGQSQLYYLRSAVGAFGLLTTAGIAALIPSASSRARVVGAVAAAAVLGAAAVTLIQVLGPSALPQAGVASLWRVVLAMAVPVIALAVVAIVGAFVARRLQRRPSLAGLAPILVVALLMGFGLPASGRLLASAVTVATPQGPAISGDAIASARWLRDHSDPSDVVATNLHCALGTGQVASCDHRHFWVSAYSERRVLVEGWAYMPAAIPGAGRDSADRATASFWDPALLALNDSAFMTPSLATLAELRLEHGVRWLFADLRLANGAAIARFAPLRYQSGDYAVYELT